MDERPSTSKGAGSSLVPDYDSSGSEESFLAFCSEDEAEIFSETEMATFKLVQNPLADLLMKYKPKKPIQARACSHEPIKLSMVEEGLKGVIMLDDDVISLSSNMMRIDDLEKILKLRKCMAKTQTNAAEEHDGDDEFSGEEEEIVLGNASSSGSKGSKKKARKDSDTKEKSDDEIVVKVPRQRRRNPTAKNGDDKKKQKHKDKRSEEEEETKTQKKTSEGNSKNKKKQSSERETKRKRQRSSSNSNSRIVAAGTDEEKKDKKKKVQKDSSVDDKGDEEEKQLSSDEDLNTLNKVIDETPAFISIKDLKEKQPYKILKFKIVETTNGKRVRLSIVHSSYGKREVYVHLPVRVLQIVTEKLDKLNRTCASKKPMYIVHMGLRGRAFILKFTQNPNKHL